MFLEESSSPKKKMCNVIIIDASGSMGNKVPEVIGGLKELFKDIRANSEMDQHTIICDFSSSGDFRILVNSMDREELRDSLADAYRTRGGTALYDAIAKAFALVPEDCDGVYVNIMTDGEENDSKEFKADTIKKLIEAKNEAKWGITFMGTTQDAMLQAQTLGIAASNMMAYADSGEGTLVANLSRSASRQMYTKSVYMAASAMDVSNTGLMENIPTVTTTETVTPDDLNKKKTTKKGK